MWADSSSAFLAIRSKMFSGKSLLIDEEESSMRAANILASAASALKDLNFAVLEVGN